MENSNLNGVLIMREAMFYETMAENKVRCNLCRNRCKIQEARTEICGVRENRGGKLFSCVYGRIAAEHIDPIKKSHYFISCPGHMRIPLGQWVAIFAAGIVRTLIFRSIRVSSEAK
jgi:hypothetical protein